MYRVPGKNARINSWFKLSKKQRSKCPADSLVFNLITVQGLSSFNVKLALVYF